MRSSYICLIFSATCVFGALEEADEDWEVSKPLPNEFTNEEKGLLGKFKEFVLNASKEKALDYPETFKYNVKYLNETADSLLWNWVSFYEGNFQTAGELLINSLDWRRTNNIDHISDWKPPKFLLDEFKFKITGLTDEGKPVLYIPTGRWDIRTAIAHGYRNDCQRYMVYVIEKTLNSVHKHGKALRGKRPGTFIVITDMEGLSFRQVASLRVLGMMAQSLGILQRNYPYFHQDAIIINTSTISAVIADLAKRILSTKSFERIFLYSEPHLWRAHISKVIPFRAIPKEIGGSA